MKKRPKFPWKIFVKTENTVAFLFERGYTNIHSGAKWLKMSQCGAKFQ
jgi:hypothetical protein